MKGWLQRFEPPITLQDGTTLRTLRTALEYLFNTVPAAERQHPKITTAADRLTQSAEQGYPVYLARAATMQAILRHEECVHDPTRKDPH